MDIKNSEFLILNFMLHIIQGTQQCTKYNASVLIFNFTDGCMVVPVGHYTSDQSAFEWRISFNHSERLLSTSLNCAQRHCYCLTKLLLKTGDKLYYCSLQFSLCVSVSLVHSKIPIETCLRSVSVLQIKAGNMSKMVCKHCFSHNLLMSVVSLRR